MIKILFLTVSFLLIPAISFCQSTMEVEQGSEIILEPDADISVDEIIINGSFYGGGTINGLPAYVLNLRVLLQGFYNPSTDKMISDSITVTLRNFIFPFSVVESRKSIVDSAGYGTFIFYNPINSASYFLVINHRNSIETWSILGSSFSSNFWVYDFSPLAGKAFGNNQILVDNSPVRYAIYGGDVNFDRVVDAADANMVDNDGFNFVTGYTDTDVNGDQVVDASDMMLVENNSAEFVTAIIP